MTILTLIGDLKMSGNESVAYLNGKLEYRYV